MLGDRALVSRHLSVCCPGTLSMPRLLAGVLVATQLRQLAPQLQCCPRATGCHNALLCWAVVHRRVIPGTPIKGGIYDVNTGKITWLD